MKISLMPFRVGDKVIAINFSSPAIMYEARVQGIGEGDSVLIESEFGQEVFGKGDALSQLLPVSRIKGLKKAAEKLLGVSAGEVDDDDKVDDPAPATPGLDPNAQIGGLVFVRWNARYTTRVRYVKEQWHGRGFYGVLDYIRNGRGKVTLYTAQGRKTCCRAPLGLIRPPTGVYGGPPAAVVRFWNTKYDFQAKRYR